MPGAVDLVAYRPSEFEDRKDLPFLRHAMEDAVVIYERCEKSA
jgi:hypothetical protein